MDLDTSVKKFKYNVFFKLLCVVLCIITMASAVGICLPAIASIYYNNNTFDLRDEKNWTNTHSFYSLLVNDFFDVSTSLTVELDIADKKEELLAEKDRIVNEAYEQSQRLNTQEKKQNHNYEEYGYYETTVVDYSDCYEIVLDGYYVDSIDISSQLTKEEIEKYFDDNVDNWARNICYEYTNLRAVNNSEISYYAILDDNVNTNLKEFNEGLAYESDYYIIIKNGELEYNGINRCVCESFSNSLMNSSEHFVDESLYIFFNDNDLNFKPDVQSLVSKNSEFAQLKYLYNSVNEKTINPTKCIVLSVALLLCSLMFAIVYFSVTGKESKTSKAKLRFYDHIPFELEIGIAGAIVFLVLMILSSIEFYQMAISIIGAVVILGSIIWALLFMLCSSNARYINSDKSFYKHLLIFWIGYGIYKLISLFNKKVLALLNKLSYKPKKFKRNVIILSLLWMLANLIAMALLLVFIVLMTEAVFFIIPVLLIADLFLTLNIFTLIKVCDYVKNLDIIISSATEHNEIMLDLNNLDSSLKMLAEGMRYTNEQLQTAVNRAVKDERLRSELITNVSHDLKTPLTSIITYVDLLSKCDINDEKAKEYIAVLDEKGAKLKRLIDDLIEASKVTSGNVTIELNPINLSELCLQATVESQEEFEKAGLDLVVKQGEKPVIIFADGTKTNRVIENLLSNARKYSAKASRVYVNVYNENAFGVFEIKNISAQPLDITPDELTERFVRGDKSRSQEGNGLGLSIAKELCSLQNGELELSIDGDLFKARVKLPIS